MSASTDLNEPIIPLADAFAAADKEAWLALVDKVLKGQPRAQLNTSTLNGLELRPLYTRSDTDGLATALAPGSAPFTRSTATRMAAPSGWRIGQLASETTPQALAARIQEDLIGGVDAVTIRIAAPGQSGLPADFKAIEAMLSALPTAPPLLSLMPGGHAIHAALSLIALARQAQPPVRLAGLGIDPLGVLARTGELHLMRRDGVGFQLGVPWLPPPITTLLADTRPYHDAGASDSQELAALLVTLTAYLRAAEGEGLPPADALPRIAIAMATDADLFGSIAKLRAARRLVWRMADACGAGEAAGRVALTVSTSERMMTRRDPWLNILRATAACAAAAMGGADEIIVLPFTWALGQPDAFARRIARNVGLVLREEAGLGHILDPAGGSWYVERLSDQLAHQAWTTFQAWETAGGLPALLLNGRMQDDIAAVAEARAEAVATGQMAITGLTAFPFLGEQGVTAEPWPKPPAATDDPVARPLDRIRPAAPFETLRDAADRTGSDAGAPRVFLASLGPQTEHAPRSTWTTGFLAVGGIETIPSEASLSSVDIGRQFAASGATVAVICGADARYDELAEATVMALKAAGAQRVYLVGRPGDGRPGDGQPGDGQPGDGQPGDGQPGDGRSGVAEAQLRAAGVDGFLFRGCDMLATLTRLLGDLTTATAPHDR